MSNYGPKKAGLYNTPDNERRKVSRTGDVVEGIGPNTASRSYSSKPGQLSAKDSAAAEQKKVKQLSGPVKVFSPEEKAALATKMGLKQSEQVRSHPAGDLTRPQIDKVMNDRSAETDPKIAKEECAIAKNGQWSLKTNNN